MSMMFLIVENEIGVAEAHSDALQSAAGDDATIRRVDNPGDATKLLSVEPCFDAVICDLSFDDADGVANSKGAEVGRWMRERGYPAKTYISTAKFHEQDAEYKRAAQFFDGDLPTGAKAPAYELIAAEALANKKTRLEASQLLVTPRLAESAEQELRRIFTLRDSTIETDAADYFEQGFEIVTAQPVVNGFAIGAPLFLWLRRIADGVYVEVFGHPRLLAFGHDLDAALEAMNDVLSTTYLDVMQQPPSEGPMKYIARFLSAIYDEEFIELFEVA